MSGERQDHYEGALAALNTILQRAGAPLPGLIVMDRELALLNALNVLPD